MQSARTAKIADFLVQDMNFYGIQMKINCGNWEVQIHDNKLSSLISLEPPQGWPMLLLVRNRLPLRLKDLYPAELYRKTVANLQAHNVRFLLAIFEEKWKCVSVGFKNTNNLFYKYCKVSTRACGYISTLDQLPVLFSWKVWVFDLRCFQADSDDTDFLLNK